MTQAVQRKLGLPWLERAPAAGGEPEVLPLAELPFTIGRGDSVDLTIPSARVSREHAVIERQGTHFRIRDLRSTNGTYLNGKKIQDAILADGDVLAIADAEFTFCLAPADPCDRHATQVMPVERASPVQDLLLAVRRRQQTLLIGGPELHRTDIAHLEKHRLFGCRFTPLPPASDDCISEIDTRVAGRLRRLVRLRAIEQAAVLPHDVCLMLPLESCEIGAAGVVESLAGLAEAARPRPLVVVLPDAAMTATSALREFHDGLRKSGIGVAHDGFAGGPAQLGHRMEILPDLVLLASAVVRSGDRGRQRQRLKALAIAAQELRCTLVAPALQAPEEISVCLAAGIKLGMSNDQ